MAKNGFRLIDAEMHVMEPVDLWQRYIDPEYPKSMDRFLALPLSDSSKRKFLWDNAMRLYAL